MRSTLLVALAVSLMLPLAACNDDDPDAGDSDRAEKIDRPVTMDAAWSADVAAIGAPAPTPTWVFRAGGRLTTWQIGTSVVVPGTSGLAAFDAEDGTRLWHQDIPKRLGRVCGTSEEPNQDGTIALMLADNAKCDVRTIAAFDANVGKLLWSQPLGDTEFMYDDVVPIVSENTVSMPIHCDDVRRFDARTGKRLPNAFPSNDACLSHVAFGEGLMVASRHDLEKDTDTLTAYDADSMRELWSTSLEDTTRVTQVVSAKPLVLGFEVGGHMLFQRFDKSGHPGKYVGFESNANFPKVLGILDGQFIASYPTGVQDSPTYAFDLATGKRTWATRPLHPAIAGRSGDDLLTLEPVTPDPTEDMRGFELWVGLADPSDPSAVREVGRVPASDQTAMQSVGWTDDQLYVLRDGTLSAYDLDATGEPLPDAPEPRATKWAEGDVTFADTLTLCDAIRPETIRALGFRTDLPRPSGCAWNESRRPDGQYKHLSVDMIPIYVDTESDDSEITSTEAAHKQLVEWRAEKGPAYVAPMKPVADLGDEAWQATKGNTTRLIARKGNLLVIIRYELDAHPSPHAQGAPRQVQQVFRDLVAGLADHP